MGNRLQFHHDSCLKKIEAEEEEKTLHCVMHFKTLMEFQEQAEQNFPFLYTMTTVNRTEKRTFTNPGDSCHSLTLFFLNYWRRSRRTILCIITLLLLLLCSIKN